MKLKRESADPPPAGEIRPDLSANPAAQRILVVDDDASVREMLARVLAGEGYAVSAAADGNVAIEMAAATEFDLVLLDLNLPGKSGWSTFEALTGRHPLLTVIIVTARSNQLFTALGAGVGALLEKPLDFTKLLQTITQLLAEPVETRRARSAGNRAEFHYTHAQNLPPKNNQK